MDQNHQTDIIDFVLDTYYPDIDPDSLTIISYDPDLIASFTDNGQDYLLTITQNAEITLSTTSIVNP